MIMQDPLDCTFLHDEVLVHDLLAQLLLGVDVEPIPHGVPEVALVDVDGVQGLEQETGLFQVVDVVGHELAEGVEVVAVDDGHLGDDLVHPQSLVVVNFHHVLSVPVQPNHNPEQLVILLVELVDQDVVSHGEPELVAEEGHRC